MPKRFRETIAARCPCCSIALRTAHTTVAASLCRAPRKETTGRAIDPNRLSGSGEPPLPKIGLALNLPAAAGITGAYGLGGGVGRGLGLGVGVGLGVEVGVGVGVPVGVAVGVTVGVAVAVAVAVGVAVAVAVGVGLAVAVGVGVGPPDGDTRT